MFRKTIRFAESLEKWREQARRNQISTLLWTIYRETAYLDYVGGLPVGKQRQANLYALVDRAAAYEKQPSADYFNLFASSKNARKRQRFSGTSRFK